MRILLLSFLFLLYAFLPVSAQNQYVRQYTVDDGLPSNNIYSVDQDSKGYIWLTTDNGVSRFDGKVFRNFNANHGLPDNEVVNLAEDALGRIWLCCFNGGFCYISGNKVFTAQNDTMLRNRASVTVQHMVRMGNSLFMTNNNWNSYFVDQKGALHTARLGPAFYFQSTGKYLVQSTLYAQWWLYLRDSNMTGLDSIKISTLKVPPLTRICAMSVLDTNLFCLIREDGICHEFLIRDKRISPHRVFKVSFPLWMIYNYNGRLWANTNRNGLIPVNAQLNKDNSRPVLFEGRQIQNFLVDREGNYWGCTIGDGLFMLPNNKIRQYDKNSGLYDNNILKLAVSGDNILLAFKSDVVQEFGGAKKCYRTYTHLYQQFTFNCMAADSKYIAVGSVDGLKIIGRKTGQTVLKERGIKCVRSESEGVFLVGTTNKCYRVKANGVTLDTIIERSRTTAVYTVGNNDLILGTDKGLLYSRKQGKSWHHDTLLSRRELQQSWISCIDRVGETIVLGTVHKGVVLVRGKDHEFVRLRSDNPIVNCRSICIDKDGDIWIASSSGIYVITLGPNIHSYKVRTITRFNGLQSDDITDMKIIADSVYVAGNKGLTIFSRLQDKAKESAPVVYINDVLVNGRSRLERDAAVLTRYNSSNVEFRVSAIDFKSLGNIQFRYRLHGINEDWQYTTNNNIRFESLPPGKYTFEVYAKNARNAWSAAPASLQLEVRPPWWQTGWFYTLVLLLLLVLFYLLLHWIWKRRHSSQLKETLLQRQMAEIKLKAIKAQINPHFIFNTLNAIQYFIGNDQHEAAEHYLVKMAGLLRKTLEFSDRSAVLLEEEIIYLEHYLELEHIRFDDSFRYCIVNNVPPDAGPLWMPSMVLQPHIENALRHGLKKKHHAAKLLEISFSLQQENLVCEVKDNGVGRKAAAKAAPQPEGYRSKGLSLSEMKLQLYGQFTGKKVHTELIDLYAADGSPAGTLVRISIAI